MSEIGSDGKIELTCRAKYYTKPFDANSTHGLRYPWRHCDASSIAYVAWITPTAGSAVIAPVTEAAAQAAVAPSRSDVNSKNKFVWTLNF